MSVIIEGITSTFTGVRTEMVEGSFIVHKPSLVELPTQDGNTITAQVVRLEISYTDGKSGKRNTSLVSSVVGSHRVFYTKPPLTREGMPPMGIMDGDLPLETEEGKLAFEALLSQHIREKKAASAAEREAKRAKEADDLCDVFKKVVLTETENGATEVEALRIAAAEKLDRKAALKASKIEAAGPCKAPPRVIAVAKRAKKGSAAALAAPTDLALVSAPAAAPEAAAPADTDADVTPMELGI